MANSFLDLLKQFSPLNSEEAALEQAAPEAPVPAPAPEQVAEVAPELPAPAIEEIAAPAPARELPPVVAPKFEIPGTSEEDRKRREEQEAKLENALERLRADYEAAKEDARSRQFKADIFKAIGDNIGGVVAGATAMNTKAAVNPVKTSGGNVRDLVGEADKRFDKDYGNLLKQFQDLKKGGISEKDMLYAMTRMGDWQMGAQRANQANQRYYDGLEHREGVHEWKKEQADEPTTKQVEMVTEVDRTLDGLEKLESMKDFSTGPISGRIEAAKRFLGTAAGNKTALAAQLKMVVSQYGKAISGSAIAEPEFKRIEAQLPNENDSDEMFAAKLANFADEMKNSRLRILENIERSGRRIDRLRDRKSISDLKASSLSPKDQKALDWAKKNPNDPRSAAILKKLGM